MKNEIQEFCNNWLIKYRKIKGDSLQESLDKFFTLFVIYNRLYVEATFKLYKAGAIKLGNRIPDRQASIFFTIQYLKSNKINDKFCNDKEVVNAIKELKEILEDKLFNINLHLLTGRPQPKKDKKLLKALNSNNLNTKITAIFEFIYNIRCNIFHGQKGFDERQTILLKPSIVILNKVVEILFCELIND